MCRSITPDELPKWVQGQVLNTSDDLGWNGISFRSYRYSGQNVPIPPIDHYMIVMYLNSNTTMQRYIHGRWTKKTCASGDISLLSALAGSRWNWSQEIDVSHVYISKQFMHKVASEVLNQPVNEIVLHDALQIKDSFLSTLVATIQFEAESSDIGNTLIAESLGMQLIVHLLRNYSEVVYKTEDSNTQLTTVQQSQIEEYVLHNLSKPIKLDDLAFMLDMGVWTFNRKFSKTYNQTPHAYITNLRVSRAKELIIEGEFAIKEIAYECGFSDQAHMTRVFRSRLGATPGQIKNSLPIRHAS